MSCKCQICSKQFKIDILVADDVWEKIRPEGKPPTGGLLCGVCIFERMERIIGDYSAYDLKAVESSRVRLELEETGHAD